LQALATLTCIIDLDPGQALGAVDLDELGVTVDLATAHLTATRHTQSYHAASRVGGWTAENLEIDIGHDVSQFGELELHAKIRLVGAKAVHGFGVRHD